MVKDQMRMSVNTANREDVRGFIVYEGPSMLDPTCPIVAILVPSLNDKTEGGWHLWIMRSDIHPTEAIKNGMDEAICGDCPYRRQAVGEYKGKEQFSRGCYVIEPPIGKIYQSYKEGAYTNDLTLLEEIAVGDFLRLGAYGDPAAVPFGDLHKLSSYRWKRRAGYTHQRLHSFFQPAIASLVMISCDSVKERLEAKKAGHRTFRVDWKDEGPQQGEIWCPATKEGNLKSTCRRCGLCNGDGGAKDIVVKPHGGRAEKHNRLFMSLRVA